MKRRWLFFCIASVLLGASGWAAEPLRVVVMPARIFLGHPDNKDDGALLEDYLQAKLRDFPGVEWVERGELDKLLAEAALDLHQQPSSAGVVLGRLLKADVVISSYLENVNGYQPYGVYTDPTYTGFLSLQVCDTTTGSILAGESLKRPPPYAGPVSAAELEGAATAARRLLAAAIQERAALVGKTKLAPLFFANTGPSPRLDAWGDKWQESLRNAASGQPGLRLLQFQGIESALGEQRLAWSGFTAANPTRWQTAADGYLWGDYRELPQDKTDVFEDTVVEAELFLRMGQDEPQRFVRRSTVRELEAGMQALSAEVLQAAADRRAPGLNTAGPAVAQAIYARLCAEIDEGSYKIDPNFSDLEGLYGNFGLAVSGALGRTPQPERTRAYCVRMLKLASFFDPGNERLQILRCVVAASPIQGTFGDLTGAPSAEDCLGSLERLARAPVFDAATFALGADFLVQNFISRIGGFGWGYAQANYPNLSSQEVKAQRKPLLDNLIPLLAEKLPAIYQAAEDAHLKSPHSQFPGGWCGTILDGDVAPELRLKYLAAAYAAAPGPGEVTRSTMQAGEATIERLMTDLGDRKRVQRILMAPRRQDPAATPLPSQPLPLNRVSGKPGDADEPLLAGQIPVKLPPLRSITLPGADPGLEQGPLGPPQMGGFGESGLSVRRLAGWGDQLVVTLSQGRNFGQGSGGDVHLLYDTAADTLELLPGIDSQIACSPQGRLLYHKGGTIAWIDLLSNTNGVFSLDKGLPVETPSMLGFDGAGRAVVGGGKVGIAGLFDWNSSRWLTLPAMPFAGQDGASNLTNVTTTVSAGDTLIFPLWHLCFDEAAQTWSNLPADACLPPFAPVTSRFFTLENAAGDTFQDGDHLWSWNQQGITDFSISAEKVIWRTDARWLMCACPDGPNLWIALGPSTGRPATLVLLSRASHQVLGVVANQAGPSSFSALFADDRQIWVGIRSVLGPIREVKMYSVQKAMLYAALGRSPPPPVAFPQLPPVQTQGSIGMYAAILRHDTAAARVTLDAGTSPDVPVAPEQMPALLIAAGTGNADICRLLLARGARVDAAAAGDQSGRTALVAAVRQGDQTIIELLLQAKANATGFALAEALRGNCLEAAERLIKAGAPLEGAAQVIREGGNANLARRLYALNLPWGEQDRKELAAVAGIEEDAALLLTRDPAQFASRLADAAEARKWDEVIRLIDLVPAQQVAAGFGRDTFYFALGDGAEPVAAEFLKLGSSAKALPAEASTLGCTPLNAALAWPALVDLLLKHGADPHENDRPRSTFAEQLAAVSGAAHLLETTLPSYPALDTPCDYGTFGGSLLTAAAACKGPPPGSSPVDPRPTLQLFLGKGVSPDARGRDDATALHTAMLARETAAACLLAGAGADLDARDLTGRTIFEAPYRVETSSPTRVETSSLTTVELLQAYQPGSEVETRGRQRLLDAFVTHGHYAELFDAVSHDDVVRARDLLQKGASVVPPVALYGDEPYAKKPGLVFLAASYDSRKMVALLLDHGSDPNIGELGCTYDKYFDYPSKASYGTHDLPGRPWPFLKCRSALILAAESGDRALVDLLIDHGAYIPWLDEFERTAMDAAASPELAAHIAERGRPQFAADQLRDALAEELRLSQRIANYHSVVEGAAPEAFAIRDVHGDCLWASLLGNIGIFNPPEGNPLLTNLSNDDTARVILKRLHQAGRPIDRLDYAGQTPLHHAVLNGQPGNVAVLVDLGFDPRFPDSRGLSSLDLAGRILDPTLRAKTLAALQQTPTTVTK